MGVALTLWSVPPFWLGLFPVRGIRSPDTALPVALVRRGRGAGHRRTGRSVLLLTWWGARVSLLVGVAAAVLSVTIGTVIALLTPVTDLFWRCPRSCWPAPP